MYIRRPTFRALFAAGAILATACSDNTAPRPQATFDPHAALTKMAPLTAVFDQPIFDSFSSAQRFYNTFLGALPEAPPVANIAPRNGRFDARITRLLAPLARLSANAVPADVRGKTFVYDQAAATYVADPAATGAPALGVRFVLYTWDGLAGRPASPLARIGYVDISPFGTTTAPEVMEATIVREGPRLIVADFLVAHTAATNVDHFTIEGMATDGTTTLDVALDGSDDATSGFHKLAFNATVSSTALGLSATAQITEDEQTDAVGGRFEVTFDGHKFANEAGSSSSERKLEFDGALYARIVASPGQDDQFLKPDGTSLPQAEVADVLTLFQRVLTADFLWIDLVF